MKCERYNYVITLPCIVFLSLVLASCGATVPAAQSVTRNLSIANDQTVFIGDSITAIWANTPDFAQHPNWTGEGVSGEGSNKILARFQSDVIKLHPSIVHILAGTNDLYPGWNLCADGTTNTCANIDAMVQAAKANHIAVVIGTVPPWGPGSIPAAADPDFVARNARIDALNGWLKQYASDQEIVLVDYHSLLSDDDSYIAALTMEGVHPNQSGIHIMTTALLAKGFFYATACTQLLQSECQ